MSTNYHCLPQVAKHLPEPLKALPFAAIYRTPDGVHLPVVVSKEYVGGSGYVSTYSVFRDGTCIGGWNYRAYERKRKDGSVTVGPFCAPVKAEPAPVEPVRVRPAIDWINAFGRGARVGA